MEIEDAPDEPSRLQLLGREFFGAKKNTDPLPVLLDAGQDSDTDSEDSEDSDEKPLAIADRPLPGSPTLPPPPPLDPPTEGSAARGRARNKD